MVEVRPLRSVSLHIQGSERSRDFVPPCRGDLVYASPEAPGAIAHAKKTCATCALAASCLREGKKNRETGFYGGQYLEEGVGSRPRRRVFPATEAFRFDGSDQDLEERLRQILEHLIEKDATDEARNILSRSRVAGRLDIVSRVYKEFPALHETLARFFALNPTLINEGDRARVPA